jgi:hypothetical protein
VIRGTGGCRQDLLRIMGYVAWLAYAMHWPMFLATLILQRSTYWIKLFHYYRLHQPRRIRMPLASRLLYTDATPSSTVAFAPGPPPRGQAQFYTDIRPIAFAEIAAAISGLLCLMRTQLRRPTTITLCTDSASVYYSLLKGAGLTLRSSPILQH